MAAMLCGSVGGQGQFCGLGQNVEPQLSVWAVTVASASKFLAVVPPTRKAVMRAPFAGSISRYVLPTVSWYLPAFVVHIALLRPPAPHLALPPAPPLQAAPPA